MTQFIDDLKKSFGLIKTQTEELGKTITSIRDRIMLLEAEQATILDRPLCKEDMLSLILSRLDKTAEAEDALWVDYFLGEAQERHLGNRARRYAVAQLRRANQGHVDALDESWLNRDVVLPVGHRPLTSGAVFSLFREPIKEAIRRHFDKIEWAYPEAESAETYFPRLDELDIELMELRQQEALLMAQAKDLGVTLPAPYELGDNRNS